MNQQPKPETKISATLGSKNFFVSIISLILFTVAKISGAEIPDGASEQLLDAISSKDLLMIFTIAVPNLINPILKIVKDKLWTWKVLKSTNFLTQAGTVVLLGIAGFGIAFPDGAASDLVNSIKGGQGTIIITAIIMNIVNPLYHFIFDRPKEESLANHPG